MTSTPGPQWPFNTDITKMFEGLKSPALPGMEDLLGFHRRNIEAMTQACNAALRGGQEVTRRQIDIMQRAVAEAGETIKSISLPDNPGEHATKQAELLRKAYEQATSHMRELNETIQHASTEAVEVLNKRFAEAMEEVRRLTDKAK